MTTYLYVYYNKLGAFRCTKRYSLNTLQNMISKDFKTGERIPLSILDEEGNTLFSKKQLIENYREKHMRKYNNATTKKDQEKKS